MINVVAEENGFVTRYNRGSISNWIAGTQPITEAIPAAVEAFRRLLGTPHLSAEDLGWEDPATDHPDDPWAGDPITWLDYLGRHDMTDMDRRAIMGVGLFSLAAAIAPPVPLPEIAEKVGGAARKYPRAGGADAARIREMAELFASMDDRFGGGHARTAVATYLRSHVVPLLRGAAGPSRSDVLSAGGELAYLAGYMASDGGRPGFAQRYYVQAVRIADEAGNATLRATALRAMAVQAVELGHPDRAIDLADAAAQSLPRACPLRLRAWMTAMRAEAAANTGRARQARELLRAAERDLDRAESPPKSAWTGGYPRAALHHQTGLALIANGDLGTAETHLATSVRARQPNERRSRALVGSRLAVLQARQRRFGAAAQTVQQVEDDLRMVTSARVEGELAALRELWRPACIDPEVADTDRSVAEILRGGRRRTTPA
ncbi:hypothetical protein ABZ801_01195 [Actinomadura sp. NPDC047616]|uniref:hypothetical protein n=1 Tax=Actinomadura sp. NPDC047616 TaxID=3155914 RepID=UPI0033EB3841